MDFIPARNTQFHSNNRPQCSFCGIFGHSVDKCFKKHGYPLGFKMKKRVAIVNQVQGIKWQVTEQNDFGDLNSNCLAPQQVADKLVYTPDQYNKIINLIQPSQFENTTPSMNIVSINIPSMCNMAGPFKQEDDWFG